jgi:hypothetical protein
LGVKDVEGVKELGSKLTSQDVFQRITGEVGSNIRESVKIVPEVVADRIEQLTQVANYGEAMNQWQKFSNNYIKPIQNIWRMNKTLGGGSGFLLRNAIMTPALDFLARGARALDPIHHAKSLLASTALATGDKSLAYKIAQNIDHTTATGETFKLTEAMDAFQNAGLARQLESHISMFGEEATKKNLLQKAEGLNQALYEKVGIKKAADITENYQHFPTFLGFLDNLSEESIAKAKRLTDEFTSNYRNLTKAEKLIFTDAFGFYGWTKFIGTRVLKSLRDDPQRLAGFLKARKMAQMAIGSDDQAKWEELPEYLRNQSFTLKDQIGPFNTMDKKGNTTEFMFNDPIQAFAQAAAPMMGDSNVHWRQFMGPIAEAGIEMITGTDIYGRELKGPLQMVGKNLYGFVDRPSKAVQNIIKLFLDSERPDKALELKLKWKAINDLTGLQVYPNNELKNLAITKAKALKEEKEALKIGE